MKALKKFFADISGYTVYKERALKEAHDEALAIKIKKHLARKRLKMVSDAIARYAPNEEEKLMEEMKNDPFFGNN